MGAANPRGLVESCWLPRLRLWGSGIWSCVWLPRLHCICGCGNLVAPIPYPVCTCHKFDSSCFQIPHCQGHVSWGQCWPIWVRAGVHCMPVSSWHPCGSSWVQQVALLSIFTITMMYLLSQRDWIGNWLVWSENMVLHYMYVWVYTSCTFLPWRWEVLHVSSGVALTLVDRTFFLVWFRCPFAVLIVSV